MKPENLAALAKRTSRLQAPKGRLLFTEGDEEKQTYYLLSGTVDLMAEGEVIGQVRSGTPKAKNPLAHALPRPYSAVVTSDRIEYLHLDSEFLDVVVTWDQTGSYKVIELRDIGGRGRQRRRLDDGAAADQGVPQGPAVEPPGRVHAHAARRLSRRRSRHQAGRCRRLLLCRREGLVLGRARDAAQQGRREARRAEDGRHLRRGGADLRSEAQRDDHDADRRLPDAAVEAGFPHAAARAAAAMGRVGRSEAHRGRRRAMARRATAFGVRPLPRRGLAQHPGAIAATEDEGPRPQRSLRRLLRHRPAQFRLRLPAVGARLPGERPAQRPARRRAE